MKITLFVAAFAVATLATTSLPARADLIVADYLTGATQGVAADDAFSTVALTNPFTFFGTSYSTVYMSTNGFLSFTNDTNLNSSFGSAVFPNANGAIIAPLWSDWFTDADPSYAAMYFREDANRFVATWDVRLTDDETIEALFQAVLGTDGTIQFGYGAVNSGFAAFSGDLANAGLTGINAGDGVRSVGGAVRNEAVNLSTQTYTPNGGTYSLVSTVVPEAGTVSLLSLGTVALGGAVVARRVRSAKHSARTKFAH